MNLLIVCSCEISDRKKGVPKLIPLFVTVDPDRDKPANLKEYLSGTVTMVTFCVNLTLFTII